MICVLNMLNVSHSSLINYSLLNDALNKRQINQILICLCLLWNFRPKYHNLNVNVIAFFSAFLETFS